MIKLVGNTQFLSVSRNFDSYEHFVSIYESFNECVANLGFGTRFSPIFPMSKGLFQFNSSKVYWMIFLGPLHPSKLNVLPVDSIYLTLGLYNNLVITEDETIKKEVLEFANNQSSNWEMWEVHGTSIVKVDYSDTLKKDKPKFTRTFGDFTGIAHDMIPSNREYDSVLNEALLRSDIYINDFKAELEIFDAIIHETISNTTLENQVKLGTVVTGSSTLSRNSAQTYTGTSPILGTERVSGLHSLLGMGVCSLSLIRFRRFIEKVFDDIYIPDKLRTLNERYSPWPEPIFSTPIDSDNWHDGYLLKDEEYLDSDNAQDLDEKVVPLITYFSGRDGFRSTHLSLSAPFEVISNCNSIAWTLQTITHEISHNIVDSILSTLLPRADDQETIIQVIKRLNGEMTNDNLFNQLQSALCFGIMQSSLENVSDGIQSDIKLADCLSDLTEISEILTHVFDFLYFYGRDKTKYVQAAWTSWNTIPNIEHRIPYYILRCLSALYSDNIRRGQQGIEITIDQLTQLLEQTQKEFPSATYVQIALRELTNEREKYSFILQNQATLVKLTRFFFYSPLIENILRSESLIGTSSEKGGYSLSYNLFDEQRVSNPLRFLEEYSTDKAGDGVRSAWILTQLAFYDE